MSTNDSTVLLLSLCGAENPFWDLNLSWHTSTPDLPLCFLKIIPIWIPAAILCTLTLFVRIKDYATRNRKHDQEVTHQANYVFKREVTDAEDTEDIASLTFYELMTRWRNWSLIFSLKLFIVSCLVFCTVFGKSVTQTIA